MMDLQAIPDSWAATNLGSIVDYGKTQKCELADIDGVTWVVELEDIEKILHELYREGIPLRATSRALRIYLIKATFFMENCAHT
ncbi:hypothetical protein ACSZM8_18090 [Aeromonas caviae]